LATGGPWFLRPCGVLWHVVGHPRLGPPVRCLERRAALGLEGPEIVQGHTRGKEAEGDPRATLAVELTDDANPPGEGTAQGANLATHFRRSEGGAILPEFDRHRG